jgi:CheY-like chemotaxis protein
MFKRILIYGNDSVLLMTRQLIFEKAGYQVITANDFWTAIRRTTTQIFDVLILCQTLTNLECNSILSAVRQTDPSMNIIILDSSRAISGLREYERNPGDPSESRGPNRYCESDAVAKYCLDLSTIQHDRFRFNRFSIRLTNLCRNLKSQTSKIVVSYLVMFLRIRHRVPVRVSFTR